MKKIRIVFILVLILSITIGITFSSQKTEEIQTSAKAIDSKAAENFFYSAQYDNALDEYLRLAKEDKLSPEWYVRISEIYSVRNEQENSRGYIQLAKDRINKNSDELMKLNANAWKVKKADIINRIIFTEAMNKDYSMSLEDGEKYLKEYPENKQIIKTMLMVYLINENIEKAKALVEAFPVDISSAYGVAEHASMRLMLNQWDEGITELMKAWQLDKDEYKIFDVLAQTATYNRDKLLEKLTALSEKFPQEVIYKIWKLKIYSMDESTSEDALKLFWEIQSDEIGSIERSFLEISVMQNSKKTEIAQSLMDNLVKENPNDYRVLHYAGWFYLKADDTYKAMEYCKNSIEKNPDYPDNYGFLMPEILKKMGQQASCEPYYRTALLEEPYNCNIILNIANFYWHISKDGKKAYEYYKQAKSIEPEEPEIKYDMALICLTLQKDSEAEVLLKEASDLDKTTSKYHRTLGTIYMLKGKYDEAIKEINAARQSDSEDLLALNNEGCYYFVAVSDMEKGLECIKKAYDQSKSIQDENTRKSIEENYNKAQKFTEDYKNGEGGEDLQVPNFELFY